MSSLVITVDDTVDIVMSAATGATALGLVTWNDPVFLRINEYAPDSRYLDWSTFLGSRRQMGLLNWTVAPFGAANEAAADALIVALEASVARMGFTVTRNKNGVSKVYLCDPGSVTPAGETTKVTLDRPSVALWTVSIPCSLVSA